MDLPRSDRDTVRLVARSIALWLATPLRRLVCLHSATLPILVTGALLLAVISGVLVSMLDPPS